MFGLTLTDFLVVFVYLAGITWIGLRSGGRARTASEYFMPRKFGKWMLTMATFGTGTSSDQAVTVASKTFSSGASGIWYQWLFMFATPFFWLVMPLMRRFRAITMSDVFAARFDRNVGRLFCVAGLLKCVLSLGLVIKGTGAILEASSANTIDSTTLLILITLSFLAYSLVGGLSSAIVTECIQGVLTIIFSFLLLPSVLYATGGVHGMKQTLNDPSMFVLFLPGVGGPFQIVMFTLSGLAMLVMIPENMGISASGRGESDGQVGFVTGAFIKRVCTIAWCLIGLGGAAYFSTRSINPDQVYGLLAYEFLPSLLPGLLGLFIACMLAASMSTCSAILVAASALFTTNLYRPFRPARSESAYIRVGRTTMILISVLALGFALLVPGLVKGLEVLVAITPIMGITFWTGYFWRRTTVAGVWVATIIGYCTWVFCVSDWGAATLASLWDGFVTRNPAGVETSLAWQMFLIFATTIGSIVVVSLLTKRVPQSKLDAFYALTRTPVQPGEVVTEPCIVPAGALVPEPRYWIAWKELYIPRPGRRSTVGFLICCGIVAILVIGFECILRL